MKKIVASLMALGSTLIVVGCSILPGNNVPPEWFDGTQQGDDTQFGGPDGSGATDRRMLWEEIPEEARTLMEQMRSARESGDTAKEAELRKELETKYPSLFGSGSRGPRMENGSGSYRRGAPQSRNTDTSTRAS